MRGNAPGKATKLNKVARKLVNDNADSIANGLLEAAAAGHTLSTELLLKLAAVGVDIEGMLRKRPLNTIAMRLGAERQLPKDHPDEETEKDSPRPVLLTV